MAQINHKLTLGPHSYPGNHPYTHYRITWAPHGGGNPLEFFLPNGDAQEILEIPPGDYMVEFVPSNADGSQVDAAAAFTKHKTVVGLVEVQVPMDATLVQLHNLG
jgi:hypothetical protein